MLIKPFGTRILVQTVKETKKSSIVTADNDNSDKIIKAEVVDPGLTGFFKKGQIVIFNRFNSYEFRDGDKPYLLIAEEDILAYAVK